jgi:hypothetical protein
MGSGITSAGSAAVFGESLAATGTVYGVQGSTASVAGVGVRGVASAGAGVGVSGSNSDTAASSGTLVGVSGSVSNTNTGVAARGVSGTSPNGSFGSAGVYGTTTATSGNPAGVYGSLSVAGGYGVVGDNNAGVGVYGRSNAATNGSSTTGRSAYGGVTGITLNNNGSAGHFIGRVVIDNTAGAGSATTLSDPFIVWNSNNTASGFNPSGALFTPSDRNAKKDFTPVDTRGILEKVVAMPVTTWHYKNDDKTLYMGPLAQDFRAAFGLGDKDTVIHSVNAEGVAFAAIQGLNQKLEAELKSRDATIAQLKAEHEQKLAFVELRLQKLENDALDTRSGSATLGLGVAIGTVPAALAIFVARRRRQNKP